MPETFSKIELASEMLCTFACRLALFGMPYELVEGRSPLRYVSFGGPGIKEAARVCSTSSSSRPEKPEERKSAAAAEPSESNGLSLSLSLLRSFASLDSSALDLFYSARWLSQEHKKRRNTTSFDTTPAGHGVHFLENSKIGLARICPSPMNW